MSINDDVIEHKVRIFYWNTLMDKRLATLYLKNFLNSINNISFYIFENNKQDIIYFRINELEFTLLWGSYLIYDSYYNNFATFYKLPNIISKLN